MAHGSILNQTAGNSLLLDGSKAMEANLDMGNHSIINLAAGTSNASAVRRDQLTAANTTYSNSSTSSIITSTNVQGAIDQLFTSVSNGKELIADAITDKGVTTSASASFQIMANNIGRISTGYGIDTDTATFTPRPNNERKEFTSISFSGLNFGNSSNIQFLVVWPYAAQDGREWIQNYCMWVWGPQAGYTGDRTGAFHLYGSGTYRHYDFELKQAWEISFSTNGFTISAIDNAYYVGYGLNATGSGRLTWKCLVVYNT